MMLIPEHVQAIYCDIFVKFLTPSLIGDSYVTFWGSMMKKKSHAGNCFVLWDLEPRNNRFSRFWVMSQKVGWLFEDHFWRGSLFLKFWLLDFGHKMADISCFKGSDQRTIQTKNQIKWNNEDCLLLGDMLRIILEIFLFFTFTFTEYCKNIILHIFHQKWLINT